jgi:hypothetical protein
VTHLGEALHKTTKPTTSMKWEAKLIRHKGQDRIAIYFEKKNELIARIKKTSWSAMERHLDSLAPARYR